jgi:hypothetical protein
MGKDKSAAKVEKAAAKVAKKAEKSAKKADKVVKSPAKAVASADVIAKAVCGPYCIFLLVSTFCRRRPPSLLLCPNPPPRRQVFFNRLAIKCLINLVRRPAPTRTAPSQTLRTRSPKPRR